MFTCLKMLIIDLNDDEALYILQGSNNLYNSVSLLILCTCLFPWFLFLLQRHHFVVHVTNDVDTLSADPLDRYCSEWSSSTYLLNQLWSVIFLICFILNFVLAGGEDHVDSLGIRFEKDKSTEGEASAWGTRYAFQTAYAEDHLLYQVYYVFQEPVILLLCARSMPFPLTNKVICRRRDGRRNLSHTMSIFLSKMQSTHSISDSQKYSSKGLELRWERYN